LSGPDGGLRPLLYKMARCDPVFRRAYFGFLRYLDELNTRLEHAGGGRYRLPADIPRMEHYAHAIEAMGGMSRVVVRSNEFGVTWDALMEQARTLVEQSLLEEGLDLDASERTLLGNLLALAQIAAVSNRVLPAEYVAEWEDRHPGWSRPAEVPPAAIPARIWQRVQNTVPWMYHAGALPWGDPETANPHGAYDTLHFFTHAWIVNYSLYRHRFCPKRAGGPAFAERGIGGMAVRWQLARARAISFAYEVFSTVADDFGFRDITPTECLPDGWRLLCRFLHIDGLPIIESLRDMQTDYAGASYGAALAVSALSLEPSQTEQQALVLDRFFGSSRFGRLAERVRER
jgi:hypothetical protein